MKVLDPLCDIDAYWAQIGEAEQRALLVDYDGTLAPFRVNRGRAEPYPGVREALQIIAEVGRTHLAIISGRQAHEVWSLLELWSWRAAPEVWGTHGWERLWPDGRYEVGPISPAATEGLHAAEAWASVQGWAGRLERKRGALAFHVRGLPRDAAKELEGRVRAAWASVAERAGLGLHSFDGGVELRAEGRDKGYATESILAELGGDTAVAYLGDDETDEDAFVRLRSRGLGVLVRPELRPTAAAVWLRPPEELIDFLRRWATAAGG